MWNCGTCKCLLKFASESFELRCVCDLLCCLISESQPEPWHVMQCQDIRRSFWSAWQSGTLSTNLGERVNFCKPASTNKIEQPCICQDPLNMSCANVFVEMLVQICSYIRIFLHMYVYIYACIFIFIYTYVWYHSYIKILKLISKHGKLPVVVYMAGI